MDTMLRIYQSVIDDARYLDTRLPRSIETSSMDSTVENCTSRWKPTSRARELAKPTFQSNLEALRVKNVWTMFRGLTINWELRREMLTVVLAGNVTPHESQRAQTVSKMN